jgi:hypothetical protein
MNIQISLDTKKSDTYNKSQIVNIHLGGFSLQVRSDDRYLTDCLLDGYCNVRIPSNAVDVFMKHKLYQFTDQSNPEIMNILRNVFIEHNEAGFISKNLQGRKVKALSLELKQDKAIPGLLNDPNFQRLNSKNDSQRKSDNDKVITASR